jgi:BON domain
MQEGKPKMDDKTLRQNVIDELDFEPSINAANIGVAVEKGVVTLTGHVASYAEKIAAERAVERVRGVRAVAQEIEVRYAGQPKRSDDEIARRALDIINWSVQVPADASKSRSPTTKSFSKAQSRRGMSAD